jgi:hypothetical protein
MTVLITLTTAGISTGPFNLYSNVDGYAVPFESSVPKASLVLGYTSVLVPTGTTTVQVKSLGTCTTGVNILIGGVTTTTAIPTTTVAPTSTTTVAPTTTAVPAGCNNMLFTATSGLNGGPYAEATYTNCDGQLIIISIPVYPTGYVYCVGPGVVPSFTAGTGTIVPTGTSCNSTTTTVSPLPPGAELFVVTQGYTTAQLACNNYTNNSGSTGGVGTAGQIYVAGNMAYNANGTPFVGNPALFYIITPYINITPGLESTCHISALGVVTSGGTLDCLTINIP